MSRKLDPLDLQILNKLAPELTDSTCGHAGWQFRSVLPPLSQHVSTSEGDFRERLLKLSDEELNYLVDLIFEGRESLHCVKIEHVNAIVEVVGTRISKIKASELLELYKFAGD
ncbi:MAG: hypothetical protein OIN87_13230 [Candidatus Methanoperedens sp.]|nr:hypothetical protein [Candidatus Methanoperedens sp.]